MLWFYARLSISQTFVVGVFLPGAEWNIWISMMWRDDPMHLVIWWTCLLASNVPVPDLFVGLWAQSKLSMTLDFDGINFSFFFLDFFPNTSVQIIFLNKYWYFVGFKTHWPNLNLNWCFFSFFFCVCKSCTVIISPLSLVSHMHTHTQQWMVVFFYFVLLYLCNEQHLSEWRLPHSQ